jgi:hypothetical protein
MTDQDIAGLGPAFAGYLKQCREWVAVADAIGIEKTFTEADQIIGRYRELLAEKAARAVKELAKAERKAKRKEKRRAA